MSNLRIMLRPLQNNVKLELGAIANIYNITGGSKKGGQTLRDQIISDTTDIQLDPGKYLVEAILPSGETSYNEVTLTDPNDSKDLTIGSRSPHEWRPMQDFFVGYTGQKAVRNGAIRARTFTKDHEPVHVSSEVISIPAGQSSSYFSDSWSVHDRLFEKSEKRLQLPPGTSLTTKLSDHISIPFPSARNLQPAFYSENDRFFEFNSQMLFRGTQFYPHVDYHEPNFSRHYLFITADNLAPQYCVLPVPWIQDHNQELTIQVIVHLPTSTASYRNLGLRDNLIVSMAIPDRQVGPVIGYLGSGLLPTAEKLLKTASNMLKDKRANPIAAAAGAYVMIFAEKSHERDEWHKWVENLMNWFPWLPDGAILHAWLKLSFGNKGNDLPVARASLLEAYRRGLPFYSKGIKMLMDGLTLFANDADHKDDDIENALNVICNVAMKTNMRQPFTTLTLSNH